MIFLDSKLSQQWEEAGALLLRTTASERDRLAHFSLESWLRLSEQGLFQLMLEQEHRHAKVASALYGLAKGSLDLPYSSSVAAHLAIASDLFHAFGTQAQREHYLPAMAQGGKIAAICNTEEGCGGDLRLMKSSAIEESNNQVRLRTNKPCATNLSVAGIALVSCWRNSLDIGVYILEEGEFEQGAVHSQLASFRTGAVGYLRAENLMLSSPERELPGGLRAIRQCFHTERFYLGVLVAGLLAGLEEESSRKIAARESTAQRQYLQDKLVSLRAVRVKVEALVQHIFSLSQEGRVWEKAAVELCVLKMILNSDARQAAQDIFESVGFGAVFQSQHAQRISRDLQALAYFGGTTELQKIQVFHELAHREQSSKRAKAA